MGSLKTISAFSLGLLASTALANAADMIPPPIVEVVPEVTTVHAGGWYLRGDIGYVHGSVDGVLYYQGTPTLTGSFEQHDLGHGWSLGGGIGYQATDYFRMDVTLDHVFAMDFDGSSAQGVACTAVVAAGTCSFNDTGDLALTVLMANAYLDLGNFSGFTPYVGAGIGGAHTHWSNITNTEYEDADPTNRSSSLHGGNGEWRFAWALHGGVSYDLSHNLKLDAGYTYTHVEGGHMFNFEAGNANSGQQGFDGDLKFHTVRAGIRWNFN